jgi:hypothetical protein
MEWPDPMHDPQSETPRSGDSVTGRGQAGRRRWVHAAVALLVVAFAFQATLSMRQKSVTTDEIMYIAAGYYHLETGSFRMNMTNPPLMKLLSALPLLALDLRLPSWEGDPADWGLIQQWRYSRSFLYANTADADLILFVARVPIVAIGVLLGMYVFSWSRRLYGDRAGLFALILYTFSPNILAHTSLATQDLGLTTFTFIGAYHFWAYLRGPNASGLLACGAAFAAAVLSKTSGIFLIPIALIFASIALAKGDGLGSWDRLPMVARIEPARVRVRQLVSLTSAFAVIGIVSLFVVNSVYVFDGSPGPISTSDAHPRAYALLPVDSALTRALVDRGFETPLPIPAPFLHILRFQFSTVSSGNTLYLAGETSRVGWWYMMLVALLIKTPIPLLCLLALALYDLAVHRKISDAEWIILLTVGFFVAAFSYLKQINVGLRYVLPIFPFLHVLASRALREGADRKPIMRGAMALLATWYLVGGLRIYPDYLAYFNEFVGGPRNGYRYLADSNLDWGQDLKGLKEYLDERGIDRIRLAYFGSADADYYGIDYDYLPSVGLAPRSPGQSWWYETDPERLPALDLAGGPIAISASLLAGIFYPGYYAELRDLEPADQVGYSILIFDPRESADP